MGALSTLLTFFAATLFAIGYLWTLITLFKQDGLLMGMLGLLAPVICVYAAIRHCIDRKGPSWTLLSGIVLFFLGRVVKPD
jgi:hypothetical protein